MYEFDGFLNDDDDEIFFNNEVLEVVDSQVPPLKEKSPARSNLVLVSTSETGIQLEYQKNDFHKSTANLDDALPISEAQLEPCRSNSKKSCASLATQNIAAHGRHLDKEVQPTLTYRKPEPMQNQSLSNNTSRKRKFPGPAGILGETDALCKKKLNVFVQRHHDESQAQSSIKQSVEESPLWDKLLKELIAQDEVFAAYNIRWVREQTQRVFHAPVLVLQLNSVNLSASNATGHFSDRSGEIKATLHSDLTKNYSSIIAPGSIFVLKKVNVMGSKLPASNSHHLALTLQSLLSIHYLADGEFQSSVHQDFDKNEIAKVVETVQMKLASIPSSESEGSEIRSSDGSSLILMKETPIPKTFTTAPKNPISTVASLIPPISKKFTFKSATTPPNPTLGLNSASATPTSPWSCTSTEKTPELHQIGSGPERRKITGNQNQQKLTKAPTVISRLNDNFLDGLDESTFFDDF